MFKDDLAQSMKDNHISKHDLAQYLRVSEKSIEAWLSGYNKPSETHFHSICDLLELKIEHYVLERANFKTSRHAEGFDGQKLRKLLADRKMTQDAFSKIIGFGATTVNNWCQGYKPSSKGLKALNDYFGVQTEYWSPNVVGAFTPKPQVDPKVKEKVKLSENPYKKKSKPLNAYDGCKELEDTFLAPAITTPIIDLDELPTSPLLDKEKEPFRCDLEIKALKEKVEDVEFDYKLQVDYLEDRIKTLEKQAESLKLAVIEEQARTTALQGLVKGHFLKGEPKKSVWERLWG